MVVTGGRPGSVRVRVRLGLLAGSMRLLGRWLRTEVRVLHKWAALRSACRGLPITVVASQAVAI